MLVIKKFTFSCPRLEDVIDVLFGPFNGWRKVHGVVESAVVLKLQIIFVEDVEGVSTFRQQIIGESVFP